MLDVGTGSGAIAVSLAHFRPQARVHAVDASPAAVEVARENARRLLGDDAARVTFELARDWGTYQAVPSVVTANLPYVSTGDVAELPPSVRDFEPLLALDGGADGLDCYRRLFSAAPTRLPRGASLLLECDPRQIETLTRLAIQALPGAHVTEWPNLSGAARVLEVRRRS